MAIVELNDKQRELLHSLGLPDAISTDMSDEEWVDLHQRLLLEVQLHGFNEAFDGENDYGMLCSSVYNAMVDAEEKTA